MVKQESEELVNLQNISKLMQKVLNIELLKMTKQKMNRIKSIASVVASVHHKSEVNLEESLEQVCEMLDLDKDKFQLILDIIQGCPFKIFGFKGVTTHIVLDEINNFPPHQFSLERIDMLQEMLDIDNSDAVIRVAKCYMHMDVLDKQANELSDQIH